MKILNATDLLPVSANYAGDSSIKFDGDNTRIETNDGYPYFVSTVMNSLVDVKANKYSFFGLTSAMNTTELISDTVQTVNTLGPVALALPMVGYPVFGVDSGG